MSKIHVELKIEAHGQMVILRSDDSSGDNPAFALHDINVTLDDFSTQLSEIIPAVVGVRQQF